MRTRFLTGDTDWINYGGIWITRKLNNGNWDYWLVIELINMDEACGRDNEGRPRYIVEVSAVSPAAAGEEHVRQALELCGPEGDITDIVKVECLYFYGIKAPCQSWDGNNAHKLLRKAHRALNAIASMFGFFMDSPKNRVGHSGWDYIAGDLSIGAAQANRERWGDKPPQTLQIVEPSLQE
jgi:hypothetical protein